MTDGFETKVTVARPNTNSLRTTIPEGVAKVIGLKAGDTLKWKIEVKEGRMIVLVSFA